MGEPPGTAPRFGTEAPPAPQAGPSNPGTEPMPMPVWDTDRERRSDATAESHTASPPPASENATHRFGGPPPNEPSGLGGPDNATQHFGGPRLGDPGPWASPAENATQRLDGPPPPGNEPGAFGGPPDNATQRLDNPGYEPAAWRHGAPPAPGQEPSPWGPAALPPAGWDPAGPPPGPPADGQAGPKNRKLPLLIGGIVAAVLVCGGLVYFVTQGSPGSKDGAPAAKSQPDASARQAAAVDQVLRSGRAARGHLPARLRTCDDVSAGVPNFQQVVHDRQQELSQSKNLAVDQLRDGQNLRRSMIAAYQHSLDADQAYLAWAQDVRARGCGGRIAPLTGHYREAIAANGKAGPAKRQVAALWRPIAKDHDLPTYAWNRL